MSVLPRLTRPAFERAPEGQRKRRPLLFVLLATVLSLALFGGAVLALHLGQPNSRPASIAKIDPSLVGPDPTQLLDNPTCLYSVPAPHMMTPAQLADPYVIGKETLSYGRTVPCIHHELFVPSPPGGTPRVSGQLILVSLSMQWLWAYQDGKLVFANPVTTGREWLWTPEGSYHVSEKVQDTWFYSPWPPSSPWYYTPEHVNYALYFRDKGYYIHDAPWRQAFGPGTNVPHRSPDGTYEDGSHGCVNTTTAAAAWLFNWTKIGASVTVVN